MTRSCTPHTDRRPGAFTGAFTLIELLVAVGIIVILIGILIPTLGSVRNAARKTQTQSLASQVVNATAQFQADKRRLPGYFPLSAMASRENVADFGFTESENVLLDLVGGIVDADENEDEGIFTVGPGDFSNQPAQSLAVRISIGAAISGKVGGGYLVLDDKVLRNDLQGQKPERGTILTQTRYVDLVDPFGMPMAIWTENRFADPSAADAAFGAGYWDGSGGTENARFYWAVNAGYFVSDGLGVNTLTPQTTGVAGTGSALGLNEDAVSDTPFRIELSMAGILGSPTLARGTALGSGVLSEYATPEAARGSVVVVSAGADRVFFSRRQDPGGPPGSTGPDGAVGYLLLDRSATPVRPQAGSGEASRFDDVIVSGN